jgi:hypothetical protein
VGRLEHTILLPYHNGSSHFTEQGKLRRTSLAMLRRLTGHCMRRRVGFRAKSITSFNNRLCCKETAMRCPFSVPGSPPQAWMVWPTRVGR